jgi:putative transposase
VLFFIDLRRRKALLADISEHPIGSWVTQQARNFVAGPESEGRIVRVPHPRPLYEVRWPFDEVTRSVGARVNKTPVRASRANAFAGRFVRTARTECMDWLLIRSERQLQRVLSEFHYNAERPHRGIDLKVPVPYLADK